MQHAVATLGRKISISLVMLLWFPLVGFAETNSPSTTTTNISVSPIASSFPEARAKFEKDKKNPETVWQFGRDCFDFADAATNDQQRAEIASEGIAACRSLTNSAPKLVMGHYYLAMNLGQLARTKFLGALPLVDEMERIFKVATELDAKFDFGGSDRNLGMLYHEAPGWPASLGNKTKARQHLLRAIEIAPDYPENRLYLLEACLKWNDKKEAQRQYEALETLWPKAKKDFIGPAWQMSWSDWNKRLAKIKSGWKGK